MWKVNGIVYSTLRITGSKTVFSRGSLDGWIYFGKINQSGIQDTVDFDSIGNGILGNWGLISFCIRKNKSPYINEIKFRIQNREGITSQFFCIVILLNTQKKHCYALFVCCLNQMSWMLVNFFPLITFNSFLFLFRRHLLFKYWQELKSKNTKKSNSASMFCFELEYVYIKKYDVSLRLFRK
jgi:hypothetical protein